MLEINNTSVITIKPAWVFIVMEKEKCTYDEAVILIHLALSESIDHITCIHKYESCGTRAVKCVKCNKIFESN